ncbi:MAG: PQQ-binding-like beta-propeller repeat protein [Gemmatimonadales bacterium]|nr:PQQ-binding-like beta-propeller repeat protein [Gemmatimonadales bacterium]
MAGSPAAVSRPARAWRVLDALAGLALVVASTFQGLRIAHFRTSTVVPDYRVLLAAFGGLVLLGVAHAARWGVVGRWRAVLRWPVVALGIGGSVAIGLRIPLMRVTGPGGWPLGSRDVGAQTRDERATLRAGALLLAAQIEDARLATGGWPASVADVSVPPDWPLPISLRASVGSAQGGVDLRVRLEGGRLECQLPLREGPDVIPAHADGHGGGDDPADGFSCIAAPPAAGGFADIRRAVQPGVTLPEPSRSWPQFRLDASHSGQLVTEDSIGHWWRMRSAGPIRTTASSDGDAVFIGTHGTGVLEARSLVDGSLRWRARAPNWIHSDPVTDGQVVVVGFGDNFASVKGRAPAGISAHDRRTGRRLWAAFAKGSVMTSPVITGGRVLAVSALGEVEARDLRSGRLAWRTLLDGAAVMGPPLLDGDLVVALDPNLVVALVPASGVVRWSRRLPDVMAVGHAGASALDGLLVASGLGAPPWSGTPRDWLRSLGFLASRFGRPHGWPLAQVVVGVDRQDGRERWRHAVRGSGVEVQGHISGTAVSAAGLAVMALPLAEQVRALDPATGAVRWILRTDGPVRGPLLAWRDRLVWSDRRGRLHVVDASTGVRRCAYALPVGSDRGGPARVGATMLITGLDGSLFAVDGPTVIGCGAPMVPWMVRER